MDKLANIFKALSDVNRIRIIKMLEKRPLCVCEIQDILGLAVSTVSKHLSILRGAGFIKAEKNGKWVDYRLNDNPGMMQVRQLQSLFPMWANDEKQVGLDADKAGKSDRIAICQFK